MTKITDITEFRKTKEGSYTPADLLTEIAELNEMVKDMVILFRTTEGKFCIANTPLGTVEIS